MPGVTVTDAALSLGDRIGRYFSLVSMLPALLLVLWTYLLVTSHAWQGHPQLNKVSDAMTNWTVAGVGWVIVSTLLVALFLHPLQFASTQILEGYWGSSSIARAAIASRVLRHRTRRTRQRDLAGKHQQAWQEAADTALALRDADDRAAGFINDDEPGPDDWDDSRREQERVDLLDSDDGRSLVRDVVTEEAARRAADRYPRGGRVMPTRLGNALRRFEDSAGAQYGLQAIPIAPHLHLVAADRHLHYLQDSRQQMDTTIRLATVSLIATAIGAVMLLRDGLWLLAALLPYALAYIGYRGAVASAEEYGTAVTTVVDLDRFALYDHLQLDPPKDTKDERAMNASLMALLEGDPSVNIKYRSTAGDVSDQTE